MRPPKSYCKVPDIAAIYKGMQPMRKLGFFPTVFCSGPEYLCISVSFFVHNNQVIKDDQLECPFPHVPYSLQSLPCPCCNNNISTTLHHEGRFMVKFDGVEYTLQDYKFPPNCVDLSPAEVPVDVVKYLNIAH
jgi:hypothetical protein